MKIILTSIGTRGDMEPFLAIREILKGHGHDILCVFPGQFESLATESGFRFASLGDDFINMLESKEGKAALGGSGSGLAKIIAYIKLAFKYSGINKDMLKLQQEIIDAEQPDRIVHNGKVIYPIIWSRKNKDKAIFVSPVPYVMHPVKEHAHIAFHRNLGPFLNKLTYAIARFGLLKTTMTGVKWLNLKDDIKQNDIEHALLNNKAIYTISPTIFKRPEYWPEQVKVLGYHERNKAVNWTPDQELEDFISRHAKILLITFGSMTNPKPEKKTKIILDILQKHKIAAIINTAAGGLRKPKNFESDHIHFVESIPYDWALPKIYGIIHHGGSGTTHMALKNGCASMIIPHIIDQFLWNDLLHKKGVGPKGPSFAKLSPSAESEILDLIHNPAYKQKAEEMANEMHRENFKQELYNFILHQ